MSRYSPLLALALLTLTVLLPAAPAAAQGIDPANRPISDIRIEGLKQVSRQLVVNQIRLVKGDPYNAKVAHEDVVRLTHLARFSRVDMQVEPKDDGSVVVIYLLVEAPLLSDVQVSGNKAIGDQELLGLAVLRSGDPVDVHLIDRAKQRIREAYQKKGYNQCDVTVDEDLLKESGLLLFHVREGAVRTLKDIRFQGNAVYSDDELRTQVKSETYLFILRGGEVNPEQLEADKARVRDYYRDRGYLEAQAACTVADSPDGKEAVATFTVSEGRQFTVDKITVEGNQIFSEAEILAAMTLKVGDVYAQDRLKKSEAAILDLYGKLGFIETKLGREGQAAGIQRIYHEREAKVDLVVPIREGQAYMVGRVSISGNETTQDKVVYRQVRGLEPGRRFDRAGIAKTEQNLRESGLFSDANVTVLGDPVDPTRDVLIEVKGGKTGDVTLGAGVSTDLGLIGSVSITQRDFDITDTPESWSELFQGQAFRGAGQVFNLALQPGTQYSNYTVSFAEPAFLESDYSLDTSLFYDTAIYTDHDEGHTGTGLGVGKRLGDVWSAKVSALAEDINISDLASNSPVDDFAVQGSNLVTVLQLSALRNTTDSRLFPTRGSRLEATVKQTGAFGGDFNFTTAILDYRKYWTIDEDFSGRRTVLSLHSNLSYIFQPDSAPVFERLYAGGRDSIRGFKTRGVGPVGISNDTGTLGNDPVGGNFLFLLGLEYNAPIYEDIVRYVIFTDTGTLQKSAGLDEYRVAVGFGIRIKIPFLGQAPFAFDLAYPLVRLATDQRQYFSFSVAVPF